MRGAREQLDLDRRGRHSGRRYRAADIEVLLTTQNNEPLLEALANGQVDVGIVGIGTQPVPAQLTTRVITSEELVGQGLGAAILPRASAEGANVAVVEIRRRLLRRRAIAWNEAGASPAARGFVALVERATSAVRLPA